VDKNLQCNNFNQWDDVFSAIIVLVQGNLPNFPPSSILSSGKFAVIHPVSGSFWFLSGFRAVVCHFLPTFGGFPRSGVANAEPPVCL